MEITNVIEKRCKEVLSYEKKDGDGKSKRSDRRLERLQRSGLYFVRDGITITVDKMSRAVAVDVRKRVTASFASRLEIHFRVSLQKKFLSFLRCS